MGDEDKVRENRLRRMAKRQGLALRASGRRDQRALDYGRYALIDADRNFIVAGATSGRFDFTLDDVENYLRGDSSLVDAAQNVLRDDENLRGGSDG